MSIIFIKKTSFTIQSNFISTFSKVYSSNMKHFLIFLYSKKEFCCIENLFIVIIHSYNSNHEFQRNIPVIFKETWWRWHIKYSDNKKYKNSNGINTPCCDWILYSITNKLHSISFVLPKKVLVHFWKVFLLQNLHKIIKFIQSLKKTKLHKCS